MGVVVWVLAAVGLVALCLAGWAAWLVWAERYYRSRRCSQRLGAPVHLGSGSDLEVERAAVMRRAVEVKRKQDAAALGAALAILAVARSFREDRS